jgi:predicted aspartyl protease
MAIINLRVSEEMKRRLANFAKAAGASQTEMVKNAVAEKLAVHQATISEPSMDVPNWVPDGRYIALVRGAVAAVGDSVADVSSAAMAKFPDEPIRITRKGKPIRTIPYAFQAEPTLKCWKYVMVDKESYPILPTTIVGKQKLTTASSPDTGSSLTLVTPQLIEQAGLEQVATETIATAGGLVKMSTFRATIELPIGRYKATVASSMIPKTLPFQVLLGRNILDQVDLYTLGKSKVLCLKDP